MSLQRKPESHAGRRLREFRESIGLTLEDVAYHVGYNARTVARWESGESRLRPALLQYVLALKPEPFQPARPKFTFIDLFAGIGGFRKAFDTLDGRCVFTSEWDKYAQITYRANFGDHEVHGDITKIAADAIPDHDVLLAGFPCQPFSIAGVSKKNALGRKHGFDCDTQGTLFFEIERIIAAKQPKAFILENVKNLASHDGGRTFEVIRHTLQDKLGYNISWKIVDARRFLPQHRERIFIVGLHPDLDARFDWRGVDLPDPDHGPRLGTLLHPEDGREDVEERYIGPDGRVHDKYVLTPHLWSYLQNYAAKHLARGNGFGFGLVGPRDVARTLSARYFKDGSEILVHRQEGPPRRLTPRECARLMGFDRPGGPRFRIPVSDTQAYRQFGNAVAVPVVEAVGRALVPYVIGAETGQPAAHAVEGQAA
jgi:DNA (cytosine-5)-methyltransferase 1